jgi:hypothetical protein
VASSDARDEREVDEGDDRGLSIGEMSVEVVGVDSVVCMRRRAASLGRAVVVMLVEETWGEVGGS